MSHFSLLTSHVSRLTSHFYSVSQTVEWPHFFTEPVDIPLVDSDNTLGLLGHFATKVSECETWRFAPDAAEFLDTTSHG